MTKRQVALRVGVVVLAILAVSGPTLLGDSGGFDFVQLANVANFLGLNAPSDISCSLAVEIDLDQFLNPIVSKQTSCNNLLEFVATSDLEITIVKEDFTSPLPNARSQAVLDALGMSVDRNDPGTRCTFYDKKGRVRINPQSLLNVARVLRDAPADDLWVDPVGGTTQSFTLMNKPGKSRIFDCSFKMNFFLDPDQITDIAAGTYEFGVSFIVSTDVDEGCGEDSDDEGEDSSGSDGGDGNDDGEDGGDSDNDGDSNGGNGNGSPCGSDDD